MFKNPLHLTIELHIYIIYRISSMIAYAALSACRRGEDSGLGVFPYQILHQLYEVIRADQ